MVNQHLSVPYSVDPVKPEAFLPNVPVDDGKYVASLPVKHRDLSDVTYTFGGQTKTIEQFVRTTRTTQVGLVHDGVVVGEFFANGFTARPATRPGRSPRPSSRPSSASLTTRASSVR